MNRVREPSTTRIGLGGNKRKADISPKKMEAKKRSALGDVTNATKKKQLGLTGKNVVNKENRITGKTKEVKLDKPSMIPVMTQDASRLTRARSKSLKGNEEPLKVAKEGPSDEEPKVLKEVNVKTTSKLVKKSKGIVKTVKEDALPSVSISEEESMYQTAVSSTPILKHLNDVEDEKLVELEDQNRNSKTESTKPRLPEGVVDFDEETGNDPFQVGLYAPDIFQYYKRRELRFPIRKYLDKQKELNKNMRSILVDWMVEVQESFEMNHETLYLAVKLVDLFLAKTLVKRDKLQLVGTTALYIAAKYDERCPPVIDDFCYICDDAYSQKEVISMEEKMLRSLKFDIGVPLSYRFLRRYARCAKLDMETLTLARYILEMSLMDYDFIDELDSKMAAASLLLALKMVSPPKSWSATLQYYSDYTEQDLSSLTSRLHEYMSKSQAHLKTIRSKYSHRVFYEVAKIPLPDQLKFF